MMFSRLLQLGLVCLTIAILLPTPVLAGSASNPEIRSHPDTSALLRGQVIPHLEITKGWVHDSDDRFNFVLEVASLPSVDDIPKDAVYVFHYTIPEVGRLYFRANWSADNTQFEFFGGIYHGCQPQFCPPFDEQGNRNYLYLPGNSSQREHIQGEVIPGAPGRIAWSYPMSAYADGDEKLRWLEIKGLFAATYTFTDSRSLRYADITMGHRDFVFADSPAWHEQLLARIPGPSPAIIIAGLLLMAAALKKQRGKGGSQGDEPPEPPASDPTDPQLRGDTL